MAMFGRKRGGVPEWLGEFEHTSSWPMQPTLEGAENPLGDFSPAALPAPPKVDHPFFSRQGGAGAIAGNLGDFLLQQSGMNPIYAPAMQEQRNQQHETALMQARQRMAMEQAAMQRQQGNEDWLAREQWKRDNPQPEAAPSSQRLIEWAASLPDGDPRKEMAKYALPGFQYSPGGIEAAAKRQDAVSAAQARHRAPSGGGDGYEYRMGPNGQLQRRRVR